MRCSWFKDCFRQVHMDFHMPEFPRDAIVNFRARDFVDHLERGRVNMVALFAKCHFGNSFYNTRVGHKHSGLEPDFLMEAATECRARGIRTLAYYSLCVDKRAFDQNPAWRHVDDEGNTHSGNFGSLCVNTPYRDELALPQLEEIARDYPVDGYFIDIPVPWGKNDYFCTCPSCRRKWKQEFGYDDLASLPAETRMRLNMLMVERWMTELRGLIARHNPELVICSNQLGRGSMSRRVKECAEIGVWESQPHPGDYLGHSFACRTGRNDLLDVQVMTVRFYEGWGDMSLKPTAQLTTECAAIIGNGQQPNVGDQVNIDGTLQAPVYDTFASSFGFVEEREGLLRNADSVRHNVVLLPVPDPDLPMVTGAKRFDESLNWKGEPGVWRGAHKMLVESHLQTDLVYSVLADDLQAYPLIVLPEPGTYQPGMDERLRAYVREGGTLLAVGNSILDQGRCGLEDVFGLRYIEPLSFSVAHFVPDERVRGEAAPLPLQVRGQAYKVTLDGAEELAALYYPAGETQPPDRGFRHSCPPPASQRSPYPFATIHRFGQGRAVYIAASVFDVYWRTNHHWLRQFVEALVRHVDPRQPVEVDASGRIEANLMRCDGDLLLNLIHYALGHQGGQSAIAGIERVEAARDIVCRVRCPQVEGVVLEPGGQDVDYAFDSGVCSFTVPEIEYLTTVRLRGASHTRS